MLRSRKTLHDGVMRGIDRQFRENEQVLSDCGPMGRNSVSVQSLRFAGETQQHVEFDAVGEFDVFEEVEDAAAEAGSNFADVAG